MVTSRLGISQDSGSDRDPGDRRWPPRHAATLMALYLVIWWVIITVLGLRLL